LSESLVSQQNLVKDIRQVFESADYEISECAGTPAFDIVAKKSFSLLTKILLNLDSFKKHHSMDLLLASRHLSAYPLIVGERSSHRDMQSGVVYDRYQIPAMTLKTLQTILLEKTFPHKRATRGGIYLHVSGETMQHLREERGMSRKELANELAVSDRAIHSYETGKMFPNEKHEEKLLLLLGNEFIHRLELFRETKTKSPLEPSAPRTLLQREASLYLEEKGHTVSWLHHAPFSGITKVQGANETRMILGVTNDLKTNETRQRVQVTASMSNIASKPWFWIVEDDSTVSANNNLPILTLHDLEAIPHDELLERLMKIFAVFRTKNVRFEQS
jgi:putative transcriptional regulator